MSAKVPSGQVEMHLVPDKYRLPEQLEQLEEVLEVQVAQLWSQAKLLPQNGYFD